MITNNKVTELFCIADVFCKKINSEINKYAILPSTEGIKRRNRSKNRDVLPVELFFRVALPANL